MRQRSSVRENMSDKMDRKGWKWLEDVDRMSVERLS